MASILDLKTSEFTARLAAEQPTPGGGSAAALSGALGAALVEMVCRYTVGRAAYSEVDEEMRDVLARASALRAELEAKVAADVEAYQGYADAMKMPKDEPEQASRRDQALQDALRESTAVPLAVAEAAVKVLPLAMRAAELGNRYLIADAGVAASSALASFEAAALNVTLNAAGLEDRDFAASALDRLAAAGERADLRSMVDRTYAEIVQRSG